MIRDSDLETLRYLLHSPNINDATADSLLRLLRSHEKATDNCRLLQSYRDNLSRRIQIAGMLLDPTWTGDLERIASIIWPADEYKEVYGSDGRPLSVHDYCRHPECGALAEPEFKNGYCKRHLAEGQSVDISEPTPVPETSKVEDICPVASPRRLDPNHDWDVTASGIDTVTETCRHCGAWRTRPSETAQHHPV